MKVVHLCMQHYGGAGTSAVRLHQGLVAQGVDSRMVVLKRRGEDERIHMMPDPPDCVVPRDVTEEGEVTGPGWILAARRWLKHLEGYAVSPDLELLSDPYASTRLADVPLLREADVINFHWVAGMADLTRDLDFLAHKPIVWTMHDMNPFTGGCHYSLGCGRFLKSCGTCPLIGSDDEADPTRGYHEIKQQAYAGLDLTMVSPSRWLAACCHASSLLGGRPLRVIPYGLPTEVFKPYDKAAVRRELGIEQDAKVVLFGAAGIHNRRKGLRFLVDALEILEVNGHGEGLVLAMFGDLGEGAPRLPFPVIPAGYVNNETQLALLYSAADVYVLPSIEDNLPNVVLESLSCGTPVVGFEIGGMPDMVEHRKTGWLVPRGDVYGLADGIRWATAAHPVPGAVRRLSRAAVLQRYPLAAQARAYVSLYKEILARRGRGRAAG